MTATRDPDRLIRAWLELMPDEAPDRVVSAVLQAAEAAPQVRAWPWAGIRRTPRMNRLLLVAATALVAVALLGGTILFTGGSDGLTGPTPSPSPTASPAPAFFAPPDELIWGDWIADVPAIPEFGQPAAQVQLSIDWQAGRTVWIQRSALDDCCNGFKSTPLGGAPGELRVRADREALGCESGQEGRYTWDRSEDGLFLTLTLVEDACLNRSLAFARSWVHSLGAVNDGGRGYNAGINPSYLATLPKHRFAMSGGSEAPDIHTFEATDPRVWLISVKNPMGFARPCDATNPEPLVVARGPQAFADYLGAIAGLTVTTEPTTIDGYTGLRISATAPADASCGSGEFVVYRPADLADDVGWSIVPGSTAAIHVIDVEGDTILIEYGGDEITRADEDAFIASIDFIDTLPTP